MIFLNLMISSTIFNYIMIIYKKNKTNNKIIKNLKEKGYLIDKRFKSRLFATTINILKEDSQKWCDINENYIAEMRCAWVPGLNWYATYANIKYLLGNYNTDLNSIYADIEDAIDEYNSYLIDQFLKVELIEKDLEKQKWIEDRDAALKELEDKYDDIQVDENINLYSFSEKDSTDELYKKLEQLQEMIERKEAEKQNNDKSDIMILQNKQESRK